jgi:ATP-dependent helicase/nuclease subunit B
MHWIRSPRHAAAERSAAADPWPSLYNWLTTEAASDNSIQATLHRAWPALTYENQPTLSKPIVARLFRSPLRASVSQIEAFASCAFKHFAQYGLRLTPRDEEDVTVIDLGIICHGILERIVRQMFADHPDWSAHSAKAQEQMIATTAEQVGRDIRGELLMTGGHNQYILNHIRRTMSQVIDSQVAAGQRGKFVPWRMELEFGEKTKLGALVLPTPNGNELRLKGKIDRVDKTRDDFNFAVIDYKYSGDKLALHKVLHGLSLQLLTYLLVLQENGSKLTNKKFTPVAALYVQLLRKLETVANPQEVELPVGIEGHKRCLPRGLIDISRARLLDVQRDPDSKTPGELYGRNDGCTPEQFAAMLKLARQKLAELGDLILDGAIEVEPYRIGNESPCSWCEFRSVCRFDPAINRYRRLPVLNRADVFQRVMEGKS